MMMMMMWCPLHPPGYLRDTHTIIVQYIFMYHHRQLRIYIRVEYIIRLEEIYIFEIVWRIVRDRCVNDVKMCARRERTIHKCLYTAIQHRTALFMCAPAHTIFYLAFINHFAAHCTSIMFSQMNQMLRWIQITKCVWLLLWQHGRLL